MESGLDATLIADLKSIELDTTDHLCIEGLKGDFALASWESVEYVCEHLHRLGIPSLEFIPVDGSPKSHSGNNRGLPAKKIFLVSLATNISIDSTIKTLKDLLLSRSTPVFSLGVPLHRNKTESSAKSSTAEVKLAPITSKANVPAMTRSDAVVPATLTEFDNRHFPNGDFSKDDFPNIDTLMDELDRFEI